MCNSDSAFVLAAGSGLRIKSPDPDAAPKASRLVAILDFGHSA